MFNTARGVRRDADDERLREWRFERQKIAEQQRQARLVEKDRLKIVAQAKDADEIDQKAEALEPTKTDIEWAERSITKLALRTRVSFATQLAVLVLIPLLASAYYLWAVATPMYEARTTLFYESRSEVTSGESTTSPFSRQADTDLQFAFAADSFINSHAAIELLEREARALTEFKSQRFDPLQRIVPIATLGRTQEMQFRRFVRSDVDIQTGFLTIRTRADSREFASLLAEVLARHLEMNLADSSKKIRDDSLVMSERKMAAAEDQLRLKRGRLINLQSRYQMTDPNVLLTRQLNLISSLEVEATELGGEIRRADVIGRGDTYQTQQTKELLESVVQEIESLRATLVSGKPSLIDLSAQFEAAKLDIQLAEYQLESAHRSVASITENAAQTHSQIRRVVPIGVTDTPVFPNKFGALSVILVLSLALFFFLRLTLLRPSHNPI